MARVILHIDINSFFASVAVLKNPSLKGKPIVISGYSRRSVIATASYEARAFGIHAAMPVRMAQKKCSELIVVKGNYQDYKKYSKKFIEIIHRYTSIVEVASIDECYADVSKIIHNYKKPLDLTIQIQTAIANELGLGCSIGIAPNKFLAKMASDMKKPRGITVLRVQEVPTKLWGLPIESMQGIGKKKAPMLHQLQVNTIGDLANFSSVEKLRPILGKNVDSFIQRAQGIDDREVICERPIKTLSHSTTLTTDLVEYEEICQTIRQLILDLSLRLKKLKKIGNHLALTIKYHDFSSRNCSKKLKIYSNDCDLLYEYVLELLDDNLEDKPIRLLGVGVGNFKDIDEMAIQLNLFDMKEGG